MVGSDWSTSTTKFARARRKKKFGKREKREMGEEKFEEEKEREEERENEKVSENGENEKAENCEKAKNESETPLLNEDLRHPLDNSWDFWYLSADKVTSILG